MRELVVGRQTVTVTNEDAILFDKAEITKGDLISYYERIAPVMLPHIKNRPLTMHRFPMGIASEGFYQKDASDYFPDWIMRKPIRRKEDGMVRYVLANNAATLVYLANQACITPHVWLSRVDKLNYPDRMIFDLDPATRDIKKVRWAAKRIKLMLEKVGLPTFVMTTGSRGFHVVVPLKRVHTFDEVRAFARQIAELLVMRHPTKFTVAVRKSKRGGRIFIDTLRNARGQTGVAPYAVRAKPGAPVATPITWEELIDKRISPQHYTIKNIFRRLAKKDDPWHDINRYAVSLARAQKLLSREAEEE